jgi:hypothetical protein
MDTRHRRRVFEIKTQLLSLFQRICSSSLTSTLLLIASCSIRFGLSFFWKGPHLLFRLLRNMGNQEQKSVRTVQCELLFGLCLLCRRRSRGKRDEAYYLFLRDRIFLSGLPPFSCCDNVECLTESLTCELAEQSPPPLDPRLCEELRDRTDILPPSA